METTEDEGYELSLRKAHKLNVSLSDGEYGGYTEQLTSTDIPAVSEPGILYYYCIRY